MPHPVPVYCGKCGQANVADNEFCRACGRRLADDKPKLPVRLPIVGGGAGSGHAQGVAAPPDTDSDERGYSWIWISLIATAALLFVLVTVADALWQPRLRRALGGNVPRGRTELAAAVRRLAPATARGLARARIVGHFAAAVLASFLAGVIVGRFARTRPKLQAASGAAIVFIAFGAMERLPGILLLGVLGPVGFGAAALGAWLGAVVQRKVGG